MKTLTLALTLLLSFPLFAEAPSGDCRNVLETLAITMQDHELWHDGEAKGPTEKLLHGFGCGGVFLTDVRTHAETAGGARVRVTWVFRMKNESAITKLSRALFTVRFGDVERSGMFTGPLESGEKAPECEATFLIPETELRIGNPTLRVILGSAPYDE